MNRKINVHNLEPGMIPASDLLAGNGRLLVNSGIPLSGKHIRALKTWGVREVLVREPPGSQNSQQTGNDTGQDKEVYQDPELLDLAAKKMQPYLVHVDLEHPAMQELFRLAKMRLAREMARNPDLRFVSTHSTQTRMHGEVLFGKQQPQPVTSDPDSLDFNSLEFPYLPELSLKLQEALVDPKCSAAKLADIISLESGFSRRLLNVVNNSFYGFTFRIESIFQALTLLGTRQVTMIALSLHIKSMFKSLKPPGMNMNKFWKHSMACAIAARIMGSFRGAMNMERLFLAGILHDIGKVIL
ncbi:HDOD domain-containing protein, partial [Desulfonatronospira sp.]